MTDYEYFGEDAEESTEFVIDNDRLANWACKKIKEEIAEHDRLVEIARAEIEEINKKVALLDQQLESRTGFLKSKLYDYFQKVDHKETKTQENYKLLDGSLVWKKPSQKLVPDKDKLLAYVKEHNMPEFVKVKEEIDWVNYKKECEIADGKAVNVQTGELLPEDIITVEDVPGSFDIK
jgi:phage host-nuclease inhibitor protein Gam